MNALTHSFEPSHETARDYRNALGRFGTGVTVITCNTGDGPVGITANSFASLSLDPPLVLWSPAKGSRRFEAFTEAERYAIHILRDDQLDLAGAFTNHGQAWDGVAWHSSPDGVPLLDDVLARFECRRVAVHDGGDHAIVVGEVTACLIADGAPLIFSGGGYGGFRP